MCFPQSWEKETEKAVKKALRWTNEPQLKQPKCSSSCCMREKQPENNCADGGHAISSNQPSEGLMLSFGERGEGGGKLMEFLCSQVGQLQV